METESHSYRELLASELKRRKMGNPSYSLRAFARTLGLSAPFLSKVLKGQKDFSPESALSIAEKLGYNPEETTRFCQLVQLSKTSDPRLRNVLSQGLAQAGDSMAYRSIELEAFQIISDWYHFAILELSHCQKTTNQDLNSKTIARRLGISETESKSALGRLARLGLLKSVRGTWAKSDSFVATPSEKPSRALRNFHTQMIEKAKSSIESQPVDMRDISGITIPISLEKIEVAKKEILHFRRRMAKLLASSRPSEVYQLNIQFFSLTERADGQSS